VSHETFKMFMIMMTVSCWGVFVVCSRGVCRIDMEKAIHARIRMIPTPTKSLEADLIERLYPCAMDAKSTSISNMTATASTLLPYSAASSSFGDNHTLQWTLENQHPKRYMKYVFRWKTISRNAHTNGSAVFEHDTYMYVQEDNTAMAYVSLVMNPKHHRCSRSVSIVRIMILILTRILSWLKVRYDVVRMWCSDIALRRVAKQR
jgi:hypothetical protein